MPLVATSVEVLVYSPFRMGCTQYAVFRFILRVDTIWCKPSEALMSYCAFPFCSIVLLR